MKEERWSASSRIYRSKIYSKGVTPEYFYRESTPTFRLDSRSMHAGMTDFDRVVVC